MHEIEWGSPVLPVVRIPEWESQVKAELGTVPDILQRTSPSLWLRNLLLKWPRYQAQEFPQKLTDICSLVTAQENACRYCYGVARSQMRIYGYSEKMIGKIERDMQLAELDEKERAFIQFCRDLSRSNPRPTQVDRDQLIDLGYSSRAVAEMAFLIVNHCLINRVSTFIAIPPMKNFELLPDRLLGRILLPLVARRMRSWNWKESNTFNVGDSRFASIIGSLQGLPAAKACNDALEGAFASNVLSPQLKVLMFAVVARSLECPFCEMESRLMSADLGFVDEEFDQAIRSLSSPKINADETKILEWTRETIRYDSAAIQKRTRELAVQIDHSLLLEAFGMAALANSIVRLAVLLGE
ncbi:MAG: hypothetical protein HKN76_03945 [Saprospiraceae bacterium]|nr:hypothetical protein [Saprospiraceae bacterium]